MLLVLTVAMRITWVWWQSCNNMSARPLVGSPVTPPSKTLPPFLRLKVLPHLQRRLRDQLPLLPEGARPAVRRKGDRQLQGLPGQQLATLLGQMKGRRIMLAL